MEFHGVLYHLPRKVRRERTEMLLKLSISGSGADPW